MSDTSHPWSPNWPNQIGNKARALGFADITSLLDAMPATPYKDVARRLGHEVAPIQIIGVQFREAKNSGTVRRAAMDSLCRNIVEKFAEGWGIGEKVDWRRASALGNWSSEIEVTGGCEGLDEILSRFMTSFGTDVPEGWIPTSPDDPVITEAFDKYWPEE